MTSEPTQITRAEANEPETEMCPQCEWQGGWYVIVDGTLGITEWKSCPHCGGDGCVPASTQ